MKNYITTGFFNAGNSFLRGIQEALNSLAVRQGIYTGDNLVTYHRNLGFLDDKDFIKAFEKNAETDTEKAVLWRYHTLLFAAKNGLRLDGDFVECACYKGVSAKIICDTLNFGEVKDKKYFLYDLFESNDESHHHMPEHSESLYLDVKRKFSKVENVIVTQGRVPSVLEEVSPERISFLHIDLNNAEAEVGALELLFDRVVPGGIIIFDDYGWLAYKDQKIAEDSWLGERGYTVLELPTGQGLVVK